MIPAPMITISNSKHCGDDEDVDDDKEEEMSGFKVDVFEVVDLDLIMVGLLSGYRDWERKQEVGLEGLELGFRGWIEGRLPNLAAIFL